MNATKVLGARALVPLLLALLAITQTGCSTFNRQWNEARKTNPSGVEGAWDGHWVSEVNGHTGRLRCVVTQDPATGYRARYKATYWKIFRFAYSVPLQTVATNQSSLSFRGHADLGYFAGGVYDYEGTIRPDHFQSTYKSRYDHGVFELRRPEKSDRR